MFKKSKKRVNVTKLNSYSTARNIASAPNKPPLVERKSNANNNLNVTYFRGVTDKVF